MRYRLKDTVDCLLIVTAFLLLTGFDMTKHSIPVEEIQSGGPPKDGIPSLTEPSFVSAEEALFMDGDDMVIGLQIGSEKKAYPVKILNWHEAVNDRIGGIEVLATW